MTRSAAHETAGLGYAAQDQTVTFGANTTNTDAATLLRQRMLETTDPTTGDPESYSSRYLDDTIVSKKDLPRLRKRIVELDKQIADGKKQSGGSLTEMAGAIAERQMVRNELGALENGVGIYQGSNNPDDAPAGVAVTDCITFVMEVLEASFAQFGRTAEWKAIKAQALAMSKERNGNLGLAGLDLQRALQATLGWNGIFFAQDTKSKDHDGEHANRAKEVSATGSYYGKKMGVKADAKKMVVNYWPDEDTGTVEDDSQIAHLRQLPFGVVAVRGGEHMALISYGKVIEAHWDNAASSPQTIQATDLGEWAWESGVVVAPQADIDKAWKKPVPQQNVTSAEDPAVEAYAKQVGALVEEAEAFAPMYALYLSGQRPADALLRRYQYVVKQLTSTPDLSSTYTDKYTSALVLQCWTLLNWSDTAAKFWTHHADLVTQAYRAVTLTPIAYNSIDRATTLAEIQRFASFASTAKKNAHVTQALDVLNNYAAAPETELYK